MRRLLPFLVVLLLTLHLTCGCGGGGGGGVEDPVGPDAPANLAYAETAVDYDHDVTIAGNTATWDGGTPDTFSIAPALPTGLTLDPSNGTISGTTTMQLHPTTTHRVTATNPGGSTFVDLEITVGVLEHLGTGYTAERVADGLLTPCKFALAPDGRIFFNELSTGNTRVLLADGTLQATPFAQQTIASGGHRGLLGIVLHPDFATNGWVYLMVCTAGVGPLNDRIRILRYTSTPGQDTGSDETVIVDNLPMGTINNGGDLVFGTEAPDPRLYVSLGDTDVPSLAQLDGALAGRVLRYGHDGSIPADNPIAGEPEWCRGLRNTFCIEWLATNSRLYGADNGPTSNDELNYLREGRNFGWGPSGGTTGDGIIMETWADVIVPTGLAFHDGTGWGGDFANDLFLTSYDDAVVRRFQLIGPLFIDIELEHEVARFRPDGTSNKPLDVEVADGGALYVSTFTGIYRINR